MTIGVIFFVELFFDTVVLAGGFCDFLMDSFFNVDDLIGVGRESRNFFGVF
jgi:hypothetical protein